MINLRYQTVEIIEGLIFWKSELFKNITPKQVSYSVVT